MNEAPRPSHLIAIECANSVSEFAQDIARLAASTGITGIAVVLHDAESMHTYQYGLDGNDLTLSGNALLEFASPKYQRSIE